MRFIIIAGLFAGPFVLTAAAYWLDSKLVEWEVAKTFLAFWWTVLAFPLTYLGAVLSGLALYEVKRLSARYVARERLPGLRKAISRETAKLLSSAQLTTEVLTQEGVIPRLAANVRAVRTHVIARSLTTATSKADKGLARLKASIKAQQTSANCSALEDFWEAYETLEELIVEMDNFLSDERKRQNVH